MWRAITYGMKASPWMVCSGDAQTWGNRVWGRGNWTLEYRERSNRNENHSTF